MEMLERGAEMFFGNDLLNSRALLVIKDGSIVYERVSVFCVMVGLNICIVWRWRGC